MNDYSLKDEHKVDVTKPEIVEKIAVAKEMFNEFITKYEHISLTDESSIELAYADAKDNGLLTYAAEMRALIFGVDTTTYGVSYISDSCISGCVYCPIKYDSINAETGKPIRRTKLGLTEFVEDTEEIIKDGHTHICFLAGDGELTTRHPEKLIPYLIALDQMEEIDEIILNVTPQTTETFESWRHAVKNKSLQYRVFQETYNEEIYSRVHPKGPKADYGFRRESQSRAMDAGLNSYGLGVLLGLNHLFLQEISALVLHAEELTAKYGVVPIRVCLPTANTLAEVNNVETQHHVSAKANELAYALSKLAMPKVSIVSSERDTPEMLRVLDKYATNRTVDVQPSVGGNLLQKDNSENLLKQTTVFPTNSKETKAEYLSRGYNLVFKY